jgi:hypothetical protein
MLPVSSTHIQHPGQETPPARGNPTARVKLTKRKRWLRALLRDPDPQSRYVQREKFGC